MTHAPAGDERRWSVRELADLTGEDIEAIDRLVSAGLLPTHDDGSLPEAALARLQLVQFVRRRGFTDEEIIAVTADEGDVLARFEALVPATGRTYTVAEAAAAAGLSEDFVDVIRALSGFDGYEAADDDDVEALRLIARARETGLPDEALEQLTQVYADAMERLADAEVRIFHDYVHETMRASGMSGVELEAASQAISGPLLELIEPAVVLAHRRGWKVANRDHLMRHIVERDVAPPTQLGESTASVAFVDLVSFTPLTASLGDAVAADVLRRFGLIVRGAAAAHNGRIAKQIGDAFMAVFAAPHHAVLFGVAVLDAVASEADFPAVHLGAHHGPVLFRGGDYVGSTVNLAARVAAAAATGQFLVTDVLASHATSASVVVTSVGSHDLKGVGPAELFSVERTG